MHSYSVAAPHIHLQERSKTFNKLSMGFAHALLPVLRNTGRQAGRQAQGGMRGLFCTRQCKTRTQHEYHISTTGLSSLLALSLPLFLYLSLFYSYMRNNSVHMHVHTDLSDQGRQFLVFGNKHTCTELLPAGIAGNCQARTEKTTACIIFRVVLAVSIVVEVATPCQANRWT